MAVVYYHAKYLFVYDFSHVVIMSVHDSMLIADFLWCLRAGNYIFLLGVVFWFSLFMFKSENIVYVQIREHAELRVLPPHGALVTEANRPQLSKLFARLC